EEAKLWDMTRHQIEVHNKKCDNFQSRVIRSFNSLGLEIKPYDGVIYQSPYVDDNVFHPLFISWKDKLNSSKSPQIDLTQIDVNTLTYGPYDLRVYGWGESIARVENEKDKRKVKSAITAIANEYEQEGIQLITEAFTLVNETRTLKKELMEKIESVDKFWPGKKDYTFRRMEQCPTCRNL
ncbi:hypothetical protein ACFLYL_04425, partial [Chloroflexota bacterium]